MNEEYSESANSDFIEDNLSIASSTFGIFMLGVVAAIVGLFMLNSALDFIIIDYGMYDCLEIIFGLITLVFGCVALRAGQTTEGMVMAIFGAYVLFFGVAFGSSLIMGGYPDGIHVLSLFLGIGLLAASVIMLMSRNILFGIASLLLALSLFINVYDVETVWMISGTMSIIAGAIFLYCAIGNWIYTETGKDLLPIV